MQVGHDQHAAGNRSSKGRLLAERRSAEMDGKGRQYRVPEASQ